MDERHATRPSPTASWARHPAVRPAGLLALAAMLVVILPAAPIVLGVFLIAAVALHAWSPDLQPYVQPILRVPVARPGRRRTHLLAAAGLGVLLIAIGSIGATMRGRLLGEWEQRARGREVAEQSASVLLLRARQDLDAGNVEGAELALSEADRIEELDAATREEVDLLLERVRRCRDEDAILAALAELSPAELRAFEAGEAVPDALAFPERALTARAVEIALARLDEAKRLRARR